MPELQDILFICTVGFTVGEYVFEAGTVYAFTKEELEEIPMDELMQIMQYAMSGDYGTLTNPEYIIGNYPNGMLTLCDEPIETSVLVIENEMEIPAETIETFTLDDFRVILQAQTDGSLTMDQLVKEKIFVLKQFELRNKIYNLYQVKEILWTSEESDYYYENGYYQLGNVLYRLGSFRALQSFYDAITSLSMIEGEYREKYEAVCDAQVRAFESLLAGHLVEYYKPPIYGFRANELTINTQSNLTNAGHIEFPKCIDGSDDLHTEDIQLSGGGSVKVPIPTYSYEHMWFVIWHSRPDTVITIDGTVDGVTIEGPLDTTSNLRYSILRASGQFNKTVTLNVSME